MNLIQCEEFAKNNDGFNSLRFLAVFPSGVFQCRWLDAYMGLLTIDGVTDEKSFLTINNLKAALGDDFYKVECIVQKGGVGICQKTDVLNYQTAQAILNQAYEDIKDIPFYRLGQAIFNRLPSGVGGEVCGTKYDMFFNANNQEAEDLLWQLVTFYEDKDNDI